MCITFVWRQDVGGEDKNDFTDNNTKMELELYIFNQSTCFFKF